MDLTLLVVEDDAAYLCDLRAGLEARGYQVVHADRARSAVALLRQQRFDAAIVDRMLPDGDATIHIAQWRAKGIELPVLMLTALATVDHRVEGLDAGADDYLAKPAAIEEIDARLRALLRRAARQPAPSTTLVAGPLEIDRLKREVRREGRRVHLQPREMRILEELALAGGDVVPKSHLLRSIWNLQFDPKTKLVETHVSRLRDKLADHGDTDLIETIRGAGYRLNNNV